MWNLKKILWDLKENKLQILLFEFSLIVYDDKQMINYKTILEKFVSSKMNFVIVGGFAVIAHGAVRVTMDLDLVIALQNKDLEKAWNILADLGFKCRQPITKDVFTNAKVLSNLIHEKNSKAISFYQSKQEYLVVDLLFREDLKVEDKDIVKINLFGIQCPILSIDKLIHLKKEAARPKDLEDVKALQKIKKA
ncbi:MAG: hypothetical protein A3B70_03790 [Deltaproteobacteria bacterium RIFCSPHIGHO2_02_FULL_40_11]|nr:MAG: hypothetical protein A3B70_03790 [Deltaproteobacteria bacterium RIFCSPHIGHO2_02_FULL_40_11]